MSEIVAHDNLAVPPRSPRLRGSACDKSVAAKHTDRRCNATNYGTTAPDTPT